ncbi:EamA family transporter [Planctomycetota bacterium]
MNTTLLAVGLFAGFAHSVYSAISKSLLKTRIIEPFLLLLYINVFQAIATPILWFFVKPDLPPVEGVTPLLLAGITCIIAYFFLYTALSCGDASSVMPIMGSKVIFAGFLAIPMLGEKHSWPVYGAALLVAISIAALSYSPSKTRRSTFPLKPIGLMLTCSIVFGFTDIYIKRSLDFLDSYNFMIYYNLIVGIGSLGVIPYLRKKKTSLVLKRSDTLLCLVSAIMVLASTLLFVITFKLARGVVVPNILIATRGVFVVIISAFLTFRGSTALETQSKKVYLLRMAASSLIVFSIWLALKN